MTVPVLETARVILRPLRISDASAAYKNWASDPDVARFMRWSTHKSVSETILWLASEEAAMERGNHYGWGFVLKDSMELFGSGGLTYSKEREMFELGYNIMKRHWNMGLTSEAARAIVTFAEKSIGVPALFAVHAKENIMSGKVLEKLGFIYQNDSEYESFDGKETFPCREYLLTTAQGN